MKYSLTLKDIVTLAEVRAKNYHKAKKAFLSACRDYRRNLRLYNNSRDSILTSLLGNAPRSSAPKNNDDDMDDDELLTEAFEINEELHKALNTVRKADYLPYV